MAVMDLTGKRFGKLVAIEYVEDFYTTPDGLYNLGGWLCECDCGNKKIVLAKNLKSGRTKSCGCIRRTNIHKVCKLGREAKSRKARIYRENGIRYEYNKGW